MQQLQPRRLSLLACLAVLLALFAPAVLRAQSTNNLSEDFTSDTTSNSWFYFNGACLTAGSSGTGSNPGQSLGGTTGPYFLPGCIGIQSGYYHGEDLVGGQNGFLGASSSPSAVDAKNQGALRFTNGSQLVGGKYTGGFKENGAIVSANPFPTGQGLQVTFKTVTYEGDKGGYAKDGADGLSFYLLDGCMPITGGTVPGGCPSTNAIYGNSTFPAIGAWGGSLAYTCSNTNTPYDGLVGAYLGLGIDEFGNFLNGTAVTNGETDYIKNSDGSPYNAGDNTASGGYYRPGRIGLRGAGSVAWQALTTAYSTNPGIGTSPYYPASLASQCSNGGTYNAATNSCGVVCPAGYSYNPGNNSCVQCPAGTTFYPSGGSKGSGSCNSCQSGGTYNVTTNTCDGIGTCATGTYTPGTPGSCTPAGTCSTGTYISSTNMCGSCATGTYLAGSIQCAICSPAGTYDGTSGCNPTQSCSTGTLVGGSCYACSKGTLKASGSTEYCNNACPSGYTYLSGGNVTFPLSCFSCTSGGTPSVSKSTGNVKCSSGSLNPGVNVVTATSSAPATDTLSYVAAKQNAATPNNPQPINPTAVAPLSVSVITGMPMSLVATQHTCSTGHLWNYATWSSPTDAGTATLPTDPNSPNKANTAGILDYAALPGAYSSLPASPALATQGVTKRSDATTIFYNLKITQNGLLSLQYSQGGGAWATVLNGLDITKSNGPIPSSFRFGFAGSTGGSSNVHEIMCFKAAPDVEAASSVGINEKQGARIDNGSQAYFAFYNPVDDTGRVAAYGLKDVGGVLTIATLANWDGSCNLTGGACATTGGTVSAQSPGASAANGRQLITWNGTQGVPFEWDSLTSTQQAALGNNSAVLDYLRGVRTNEINSLGKGTYRTRDNVLGDVIDASPTWVGAPGGGYASAWTDRLNPSDKLLENSAKTSFATFQSNEKTRQNVVYAGANDGFLHAFRSKAADNTGVNDGIEVFAYMPSAVVQTIHKVTTITNADGTTSTDSTLDFTSPQYTHSYFVDATPATGDIFYDGTWHTWLVGGLGAGAPGVYILDVTDPSTFSEAADQAKAMVIGDWVAGPDKNADGSATGAISCLNNGQTNNANCGLNLGNVTDIPLIRRFHNGTWGVIFGNGAGSYNGDAGIFILTIDPQSLAKTWYYLSTGATGSNGIAATAASDFDGDRITDYVYAGDIKGNVWRFDLTSSNPTDWAASATALFSTGGQPITTAPVVANGVVGGYKRVMVAVGTGQRTPMSASNPVTYLKTAQNIYGVWDWNMANFNSKAGTNFATLPNASHTATPSVLAPKDLYTLSVTIAKNGNHDVAVPTICFAGATDCAGGTNNTQFGWSLTLPESNQVGNEQIVYDPGLIKGVLVVNSVLPANNIPTSCTTDTDAGWTYGINFLTGGPVPGFFQNYSNDTGIRTNGTGSLGEVLDGTQAWLLSQTTDNKPITIPIQPPGNTNAKRLTWIQLR